MSLSPEKIAKLRKEAHGFTNWDNQLSVADLFALFDAYESVERYKACADEAVRMLNEQCIRATAAEEKAAEYEKMLIQEGLK